MRTNYQLTICSRPIRRSDDLWPLKENEGSWIMKGNELIFKENLFRKQNCLWHSHYHSNRISESTSFFTYFWNAPWAYFKKPTQCLPSFVHLSMQKQSDSVKSTRYTISFLENLCGLSRFLWLFGIKPIKLQKSHHKIIGLHKNWQRTVQKYFRSVELVKQNLLKGSRNGRG